MHFCTCEVAIAGERDTIVPRTEFNPVSWPELEIIRFIHGEHAVTNVKPFVAVNQTAKAEKERLSMIYGVNTVDLVFPGRNPAMELDAPGTKVTDKANWKNPLINDADEEPKAKPRETASSGN